MFDPKTIEHFKGSLSCAKFVVRRSYDVENYKVCGKIQRFQLSMKLDTKLRHVYDLRQAEMRARGRSAVVDVVVDKFSAKDAVACFEVLMNSDHVSGGAEVVKITY